MPTVCPTVLAATPDEFAEQLARVAFAPRVQIDLSDGQFAHNQTINLNQVYFNHDQLSDLHLMLQKPQEWLEILVSLKPNLVIIHAEAEGDLLGIVRHLKQVGIRVGLALLPETQPGTVKELLTQVDHALIFAGHLGAMGGAADLTQTAKVKLIRTINPKLEIGWDGGANSETVDDLVRAGVDVINVGSAIMRSENPESAYHDLMQRLAAGPQGV